MLEPSSLWPWGQGGDILVLYYFLSWRRKSAQVPHIAATVDDINLPPVFCRSFIFWSKACSEWIPQLVHLYIYYIPQEHWQELKARICIKLHELKLLMNCLANSILAQTNEFYISLLFTDMVSHITSAVAKFCAAAIACHRV